MCNWRSLQVIIVSAYWEKISHTTLVYWFIWQAFIVPPSGPHAVFQSEVFYLILFPFVARGIPNRKGWRTFFFVCLVINHSYTYFAWKGSCEKDHFDFLYLLNVLKMISSLANASKLQKHCEMRRNGLYNLCNLTKEHICTN